MSDRDVREREMCERERERETERFKKRTGTPLYNYGTKKRNNTSID